MVLLCTTGARPAVNTRIICSSNSPLAEYEPCLLDWDLLAVKGGGPLALARIRSYSAAGKVEGYTIHMSSAGHALVVHRSAIYTFSASIFFKPSLALTVGHSCTIPHPAFL
jgi:hypothetical protein